MLTNKKTKRNLIIVFMAATVLAIVFSSPAVAKKGGGGKPGGGDGPVGTGTIYYSNDGYYRSMNPDGSDKTPLLAWGEYSIGDASITRHPVDGDRWFLQFQEVDGSYPITMFPVEFWWGGLDDMTTVSFTGDPNEASVWGNTHFYFEIDSVDNDNGDPDTFRWYCDFEGLRIEASGVAVTGSDQELVVDAGNGTTGILTINFASTTGHSLNSLRGIIINKSNRSELFAVSEDGQTRVQLTDDPNMQPWKPGDPSRALPRWATHDGVADGKVSYLAQRWGKDGVEDVVVERGLSAAEIEWIDGTPYATTNTNLLPVSLPLELEGLEIPYDWSPDGTQITYSDNGIWIADPYSEGAGTLLYGGYDPRWSPVLDDGSTLIAFRAGSEIRTISPSGGSDTTIVSLGKNRIFWGGIYWSPEGTHLIYTRVQRKKSDSEHDVFRVGADGSDPTNLTNGLSENAFSKGWRD